MWVVMINSEFSLPCLISYYFVLLKAPTYIVQSVHVAVAIEVYFLCSNISARPCFELFCGAVIRTSMVHVHPVVKTNVRGMYRCMEPHFPSLLQ